MEFGNQKTEGAATAVLRKEKLKVFPTGVPTLKDLVRPKRIAWLILLLCLALFITGMTLFGGTTLGFAIAFGGAIIAYEAILLLRKFYREI